jgi:hypothetical protein
MVGAGKFGSAKLPMATATYPGKPSPKSVAEPEEVFLVDSIQHRSGRSLDDLVLEGCDRQRALPPIRLGNVYAP